MNFWWDLRSYNQSALIFAMTSRICLHLDFCMTKIYVGLEFYSELIDFTISHIFTLNQYVIWCFNLIHLDREYCNSNPPKILGRWKWCIAYFRGKKAADDLCSQSCYPSIHLLMMYHPSFNEAHNIYIYA